MEDNQQEFAANGCPARFAAAERKVRSVDIQTEYRRKPRLLPKVSIRLRSRPGIKPGIVYSDSAERQAPDGGVLRSNVCTCSRRWAVMTASIVSPPPDIFSSAAQL